MASTYDAAGNQTSITYPSGRLVRQTFDDLERLEAVADADGIIASYAYVGPARVARRDTRNGVRMTYRYDGITGDPNPPGDFGVRQIIATTHTRTNDATVLDDRAYAWDRGGNKTTLIERHTGGEQRQFAYDSVNRLIRSPCVPRPRGRWKRSSTSWMGWGTGPRSSGGRTRACTPCPRPARNRRIAR